MSSDGMLFLKDGIKYWQQRAKEFNLYDIIYYYIEAESFVQVEEGKIVFRKKGLWPEITEQIGNWLLEA